MKYYNVRTGEVRKAAPYAGPPERLVEWDGPCYPELPMVESAHRVIFDDGGGITVQYEEWGRFYWTHDCAHDAARDVALLIRLGPEAVKNFPPTEPEALIVDPPPSSGSEKYLRVWNIKTRYDGLREWNDSTREFFSELEFRLSDLRDERWMRFETTRKGKESKNEQQEE